MTLICYNEYTRKRRRRDLPSFLEGRWKYILITVVPGLGILLGSVGFGANAKLHHHMAAAWSFVLTINCFLTTNYLLLLIARHQAKKTLKKSKMPKHFFSDEQKAKEMLMRKRRTCGQKVLRVILWVFILMIAVIFLLLTLGAAFQSASIAFKMDLPPGKLILVEGHFMHINCQGEGSPTIILDHDMGGSSQDYFWVQTALSPYTRVCSFDRPGYGWSLEGKQPRNTRMIAKELESLLQKANVTGPLIYVGYGYSCLDARLFTNCSFGDVVGVVLIDPFNSTLVNEGWNVSQLAPYSSIAGRHINPFGGIRLIANLNLLRNQYIMNYLPQLNSTFIEMYYFNMYKQKYWATLVSEAQYLPESAYYTDLNGNIGKIPLYAIVASRGYNFPGIMSISSSPISRLVTLNSSHWIPFKKDTSQIVSYQILDILTLVRGKKK